ncbi:MAG: hypothetical protein IJV65_08905, partial [Kiritimatiellae bacterium]|nr:hypothetical protein [Kiritimatiellia bacterium]
MKKTLFAMMATAAAVFAQTALAETVQIASAADWTAFANRVNGGETTLDAVMTADVTLTQDSPRVGTANNPYGGTFDGQCHRLTLNWNLPGVDFAAPFAYVAGAKISNLHTRGSITTDRHFTSGLIGDVKLPGTTISSCRSSVAITSSYSGDMTSGGFISRTIQVVDTKIDNCLFDGSLLFANGHSIGGFVGYNEHDAAMTISNSLFAPHEVVLSSDYRCATFCRGYNNITVGNSFYTQAIATPQGTDTSTMSASALVDALGSSHWSVSGGKPMLSIFVVGPMSLSDGQIYTVVSDESIDGKNGESAIAVEDGASAIINIKSGATLTVTGADANGAAGATPAIYVPQTATLYIVGDGTLVATGGAAGNGGNGGDGSAGEVQIDARRGRGGAGGDGGAGGGGGAPAIGGVGGAGGAGGAGGTYTPWMTCDVDEPKSYIGNGRDGSSGSSGADGGGMGKIVILGNVTVRATAGAEASLDGSGGNYGDSANDSGSGWSYDFTGGGCGGGGGGARGQNAEYGIGGGGAGGGGGGGGGSGGTFSNSRYSAYLYAWGYGGWGGSSYCGTAGASGDIGGEPVASDVGYGTASGGPGGNGGAANTTRGDSGTLQSLDCVTLTVSPARAAAQPVALSAGDAPAAPIRVTFMSDGVSVGTVQASLMLAPPVVPGLAAKTGYEFQGFYTADGTQIYSDSGAVYPVWQTVEDTTLYARWKLDAVGFTFSSGGAEIGTGSCRLSTSTATDAPIALKQGDDIFLGYFTEPTGGVKVYDENYEFALADTSILTDENIALYAQWKVVPRNLEGGITRLVYRGVLTNFGEWTSGLKKNMNVKVYDSASATTPLWSGDVADVPINPDGSFEAVFGNNELAYAFASNNLTHVELTVGDALSPLAPRRAFASVATVNRALVAEGAASDIKVGTLGANAIVAEKVVAGSLEASGTVRVEGSVSVEVKPFDIERGQETTIWRGAGVTAWGDSARVAT